MKIMKRLLALGCSLAMAGGMLPGVPVSAAGLIPASNVASDISYESRCDIDQDGDNDLIDVVKLNQYLLGFYNVPVYNRLDTNRNQIVDASDSLYILAHITNLEYSGCFIKRTYNSSTNAVSETEIDFPNNIAMFQDDDAWSTDARYYKRYNFYTTPHTSFYWLTPDMTSITSSSQNSINSSDPTAGIIGVDERYSTTLPENTGIVNIQLTSGSSFSFGTGFIVGDHVIATAAHVIAPAFDGQSMTVTMHNSDGTLSSTQLHPLEIHIPYDYYYNSDPYDYGMIIVSDNLSSYPHFSIANTYNLSEDCFEGVPIYVTGNPGIIYGNTTNPVNNVINHSIYTAYGSIKDDTNAKLVCFDTDATGGDSGSPVYIITKNTYGNTISYTYSAIATVHGQHGIYKNSGARFTKYHQWFYHRNPEIQVALNAQ